MRATDLGYQNLVDLDTRTGRVTYREGMIQNNVDAQYFCPSTGGFKSLRAMAYLPATRALYVPLNLNCETAIFLPVERREGGGAAGGVRERKDHFHFHPKSPDRLGEFQALDIATGKTLWSHRRRAPYNTAALATGGGLVFVGTWDRYMLAYDAKTGDERAGNSLFVFALP